MASILTSLNKKEKIFHQKLQEHQKRKFGSKNALEKNDPKRLGNMDLSILSGESKNSSGSSQKTSYDLEDQPEVILDVNPDKSQDQ